MKTLKNLTLALLLLGGVGCGGSQEAVLPENPAPPPTEQPTTHKAPPPPALPP